MAPIRNLLNRLKRAFRTRLVRVRHTSGTPVVLLGQGDGQRAYAPDTGDTND